MAVGKGSIGRVSKAVEKQIVTPIAEEAVEQVVTAEEVVVEEPVKKSARKPAAKKTTTRKPAAKKPATKKEAVVKKDNIQVGDKMPMYLM